MRSLPDRFRYHPDPRATGAVVPSGDACELCGATPGELYVGPVFCLEEIVALSLGCVASGRAATELDAVFTDVCSAPPDVPDEVIDEITRRTPGFLGWQQEHVT